MAAKDYPESLANQEKSYLKVKKTLDNTNPIGYIRSHAHALPETQDTL